MRVYNIASGEVLREISAAGMIRVDRNRMRALCSEGLEIHYSKTLAGLKYVGNGEGVSAYFDDGMDAQGDLVIGADGPQSAVRTEFAGGRSPNGEGIQSHQLHEYSELQGRR